MVGKSTYSIHYTTGEWLVANDCSAVTFKKKQQIWMSLGEGSPRTVLMDELLHLAKHTFNTYVQDTLRGKALASLSFLNQERVIELLNRMPRMDDGARTANDQVLMLLVSMSVLQERFGLAS